MDSFPRLSPISTSRRIASAPAWLVLLVCGQSGNPGRRINKLGAKHANGNGAGKDMTEAVR